MVQNVTLPQIRAFERTVRLGGVHAAARHLGLTQPAVSQRIRELERTLNAQLFIRQGRSLHISPEGAALLVYADQLLSTAEEMALRIGTGDPLKGVLRLGVSKSFSAICLPILVKRLTARYESLRIAVHVGDSSSINELVNNYNLDLAITSEYNMAPDVRKEPVGTNVHGWFSARDYSIDKKNLNPGDVSRHHLIITPPPSRHNTSVMQWLRRANATPRHLSTCDDLSATIGMILGGIGIGFVPTRIMRDHVEQGLARQLVVTPSIPAYEVWICYQVEELGPGLRDVVDLVHQVVTETELYI
jgi:DNA-binding transcriptional LysR family regulator